MANNRLPFGLCKKYGIDLPDDATPKDAWEALKENGIELTEDEEPTVLEPSDVIGLDCPEKTRVSSLPEVKMPVGEYAMVMHELATHLTPEEYSYPTVTRHIGNHTYRVEILGFGNYRIVGRWEIASKRRKKRK